MGDKVSKESDASREATEEVNLHGVIYITVHSAKGLRNADSSRLREMVSGKDVSDPYVSVDLEHGVRLAKTSKIANDLEPRWEERFSTNVASPGKFLYIRVRDDDMVSKDDSLGEYYLEVKKLLKEEPITGFVELNDTDGKPNGAELDIEFLYKSVETIKESIEVPDCYFPLRPACDVTLYQDAHTPLDPLHDEIKLPSGETYSPACAFEDMVRAIRGARNFIYITGWSVFTETALLREDEEERVTVGELLKGKAEEGVRILGMVWDEKLSTEVTPGLMGTHDEETVSYFADTPVKMVKVPRQRSGLLKNQGVSTCYSHHQKTMVMDADGSQDERKRIVAFVGGLDVTDGRWDTPKHHLFNSLTTYHKDDFYNTSATVRPEVGPRQPWHDIHSRVQGRIAYDVMQNFVERWNKQVSELEDELIQINDEDYNMDDVGGAEDSDQWSVQMFRSINNESVTFDPLRKALGIFGKKKRTYDDSIHRAYVHHIRRAKEFLYIENQYFQGGCNLWKKPETDSNHMVPVEILAKIIEKIQAKERFAAYIVVPMHPEGDPASAAIQEMLHWQKCTMEMMYTRIAAELRKLGRKEHPTDYLNFYCLGNREETVPDDLADPAPDSQEEALRWSKRFMIYVHSKMLISDDEIIIVGSANINQRSMGGNRDTEIAIGAQQNEHTMKKVGGLPKGKVHAFRLSLWAEHLGCVDETFMDPASLDCVKMVNSLAAKNWDRFTSKTPVDMTGHLLQYPVQIKNDGTVTNLTRWKKFLDTEAHILGKRSTFLPHKLTT